MSQLLINQYLNELATLKRVSGAQRESVVREAFKDLLKAWGKSQNLVFIPEHEFISAAKVRNYVDGALLHDLRVPFGYWEAKDADDDLDVEIAKKFRRGYPNTNIVFEDSTKAVLIQNGAEVMRCSTTDGAELERLLSLFFAYQRPEIAEFRKAIVQFKTDLPHVLTALRDRIDAAYGEPGTFRDDAADFLKQAKESINPAVTEADVREMLIQHILTEEIFAHVFNDGDFHRENNVAKALYGLEAKFFRGDVKRQTLAALEPYYAAIRSTAALISSHSEKQGFLKAIYENFYKVYNPNAADRLGVVYTPNEIVRFMVESADWLCEKHFGKSLIDKDVEILDPATGTGTFIVELLEHFRGRPEALKYKYLNELHANEVAILPYYVANLNIEATYAAIEGAYAEFPGLCFVDTLDNVAALGIFSGHQHELFGAISDENIERVKRQNSRKISVIIGNPPYNAWQEDFNDRNRNRPYSQVDKRIKETYIKEGSATNQMSVYDMYTRFFRWASDRLGEEGVVALITGRKPLSKAAYDGFRKSVERDFSEIWIMDLGGDIRDNPKLSGSKHNVFGIKIGVAIWFLVRRKGEAKGIIRYARRPEFETSVDKLAFLGANNFRNIPTITITPNRKFDWLDQPDESWNLFMPLVSKERKADLAGAEAILELYSRGLETHRDEWVYDDDNDALSERIKYFISRYEAARKVGNPSAETTIKWDRELEKYLLRSIPIKFDASKIVTAAYRPFRTMNVYFDDHLNSFLGRLPEIFGNGQLRTPALTLMGDSSGKPYFALAIDRMPDLNFVSPGSGGTQTIPRYRYVGLERIDNITDWARDQFSTHYGAAAGITKDDIFAYVYAVLHDPVYRETYALNLKREFPRIPFYADFRRWRDWGQTLLNLHIGYEASAPFGLTRTDTPDPRRAEGTTPTVKLKADHNAGIIVLDSETQLSGVPAAAWTYRLGNRSALDWVLDQHKEKTPTDPTIREKFNSFRFAHHKESVIELLDRVTTVSVETVKITHAMAATER